jgi:anti-anti-sigma factor
LLAITLRFIADVVIFDLSGKFTFMEFKLHDRAKELLDAGCRAFIFNMKNVTYIDSFAMGQMFSIWTSTRAKGGRIVLVRPTQAVQNVLETTKLDAVFPVFADEAPAIAELRQLQAKR